MTAVAVSLELIHMASLVHDDVIDEAELRRGQPTIKAKWDNKTAMYAGDYIFARAIECLSSLDNAHVHQILSKTIVELCLGEFEQFKDKFDWNQNVRTYLRRIKRKTALLIAASCQLGAVAGNVSVKHEKALYRYGYNVGMSYQIIDDVLDLTSTEEELGKPAGSDLLQGNITLPVLYAMEKDEKLKKHLETLFAIPEDVTKAQMDDVIQWIKETGAIQEALATSDRYLQKAFDNVAMLPQSKAKQAFERIAKYIGKRRS